ncbi:MAG: amidohydrolase family protein, partial [Deltaproteobacteria bacterium]|nr:amidohydrolase family protein [Deltaproteobacteria bacterium]
AGASVVCVDGVIAPGFVDAHEHLTYNHLPRWMHPGLYQRRSQWQGDPLYDVINDAQLPDAQTCNVLVWSEARHLIGGSTSVQDSNNNTCHRALIRNIGSQNSHGLPMDTIKNCTFFPSGRGCEVVDARDEIGMGRIFIPHLAEGIDDISRREFDEVSRPDDGGESLVTRQLSIIHGVAFGASEFQQMAAGGSSLILSPRSNIDLYGLTGELTTARAFGVNIALGTDWTPSGSMNQLRELQCLAHVDETAWSNTFSDRELVDVATINGARALGIDAWVGSIAEGKRADLVLMQGDRRRPYRVILDGGELQVLAVFVAGEPRYGDPAILAGIEPAAARCEDLDLCGNARRICVERPGVHDKSLATVANEMTAALDAATPAPGTEYMYELYGLVDCAPPPVADVCALGNATVPGTPSAGDSDGDGIADGSDVCPDVLDWRQEDLDLDGIGDACDPCPALAGTTGCDRPDPMDRDGDGTPNATDVCPDVSDDQTDTDGDGHGDACDTCPMTPNPSGPCPADVATIPQIQDPSHPSPIALGAVVRLTGVVVTASRSNAFWVQDPAATEWGGLSIFLGGTSLTPPALGTVLDVQGTVADFRGLTQLTEPSFTATGAMATIDPIVVPASAIADNDPANTADDGPRTEALEAMLVRIEGVTLDAAATPGASVDYVASGVHVGDFLFSMLPPAPAGTFSITGIQHQFDTYRLLPRSAADITMP